MTQQQEHEQQLFKTFILPQRRDRYLGFLAVPKHRKKITRGLAHFKHLDPGCVRSIPPSQHSPENIWKLLRSMGAPGLCWVLSENDEIDGREMPVLEALQVVVGRQMGTFLSCLAGRLAYFEDEDQRWILQANRRE